MTFLPCSVVWRTNISIRHTRRISPGLTTSPRSRIQQKQDKLDIALVEEIRADHIADIWMAVPDIVEWSRISRFRFVLPDQVLEDADIHLKRFLALLGKTKVTVDLLKNKRVVAVDADGDKLKCGPFISVSAQNWTTTRNRLS